MVRRGRGPPLGGTRASAHLCRRALLPCRTCDVKPRRRRFAQASRIRNSVCASVPFLNADGYCFASMTRSRFSNMRLSTRSYTSSASASIVSASSSRPMPSSRYRAASSDASVSYFVKSPFRCMKSVGVRPQRMTTPSSSNRSLLKWYRSMPAFSMRSSSMTGPDMIVSTGRSSGGRCPFG